MSNDSSVRGTTLRAGVLGVGAVTFFVVSAAGPLIAMAAGVPITMLIGNGAGVPAMFIIATLLLLAFAAGFTAMAHDVRTAGGFYAFAAVGLGGHAAGATAAAALLGYTAMVVGIYGLFGSAAADLLQQLLGHRPPWWVCAFAAMGLIGVLGYRQVDLSAKVLAVLVVCEYAVVLVLDAAILGNPQAELSFASFTPAVIGTGSPAIGLLMCFTAFIGFEATTLYAEEAQDPARTIPRATYVSLLVIGGFYVFSSWCIVAALGHARVLGVVSQLADPTTLLFGLAADRVGVPLAQLMRVLLVTSSFAALLAFHNSLSRYYFALSREAVIARNLGQAHPLHRSPAKASLWQTGVEFLAILVFALAQVDPITVLFVRVSAVGTLGIVALMTIASAAVFGYFRIRRANRWRTRFLPVIGALGLLWVLAMACLRFDVLAGGQSPVVQWLPVLLPVALLLGIAATERLRRQDPQGFRQLGRVRL